MNISSGGSGASSEPINIRQLRDIVLRHLWLIILTFVAVTAIGTLGFSESEDAEYTATAVVMVQSNPSNGLNDSGDGSKMWAEQRYRNTQLRIMTSSLILQKVAQELDLVNDPRFPTGEVNETAEPFTVMQVEKILKDSIKVEQDGDTMMINITVRCTVPHYCADIANAVARVYIEFNTKQLIGAGIEAENWLRAQYESRREVLRASEDALVAFRGERNLISVSLDDQYNITGRNLSSLAEKLLEAQYQVDSLEVSRREIERVRANENYLSAGLIEVVDNGVVQQLKQELTALDTERASLAVVFGEEHPKMRANAEKRLLVEASLVQEIDAELSSLQLRYETGVSLVESIRDKMQKNYADAMAMGDDQLKYERLVRETEINREVVAQIEEKLRNVELANKLEPQNIQVMEEARVPVSPIFSRQLPTTLIAAGLGIVLALGMAFGLEMLNSTVSSHEEIESDYELPFLGIVPTIGTARERKAPDFNADTFTWENPRAPSTEALRLIRANLEFMMSEEPLTKLLVTSAAPLEGKSTFAIALATIMGQVGKRVVLVDSDLRKGRIHSALNIDVRAGLSSLLTGTASLDEVLHASAIPNVTVVPCGDVPRAPAELIRSSAYEDLLTALEARFDLIIIDAPPAEPVADAIQLSRMVDGTIVVIRARKTNKAELRSTVDKLDGVGAAIVGAVFNDVDVTSRRNGYYYTYGNYGKYYSR